MMNKEQRKITNTLNARITRGIALLDRTFGRKNWLQKINLKDLDLESTATCICGQVFGDYWSAIFEKSGKVLFQIGTEGYIDSGWQFGFNSKENEFGDLDYLTNLWYVKLVKLMQIEGLIP